MGAAIPNGSCTYPAGAGSALCHLAVEVALGREYPGYMCGIAGAFTVVGPVRPPLSQGALDAMTDALTHRGPDDRGTCIRPGAAIGVRRLSIIDVLALSTLL